MTINQLSEKRKNLRQQLIDNKAMEGFKELLTVLYSDKVHFIYELLQNAEDAGASEVQFILNDDRLEFEHNGDELFTIEHVESITNIGSSTKIDDVTSIGEFGIGFKSVFAYTATPEIESGDFHFRIHDMFVPDTEGLAPGALGEKRTHFIFPFNNPEKTSKEACHEIETKLQQLNEDALLFLNNIWKIEYRLPDSTSGFLERKQEVDGNRIEISVKQPGHPKPESTHYLRFTESINVQDEDGKPKPRQIAVAFGMDKSKGGRWRIIPLNPGQVCIYFPAINARSSLRFHIHAPFASTVARDSVRDYPANDELRDRIADLVSESMHAIRDQGLLDVRFLATLPSNKDDLPLFYHPIRERLVEEFNRTKLIPMKQGGHAPASECYRGQKKLSDLIDHKDLATLLGKRCSQPLWIANPQQKNQQGDNFLSMLDISEWTVKDLVEVLETFEDVTKWLNKKSNAWHQKLYAFLGDFLSSAPSDSVVQERMDQLSKLCIVRCNNKTYRIGSECRFSNDDMESDPPKDGTQENGFHYVAKGVYSYGKNKSQQEKARRFLDEIGVSEWNIVAEVLDHILPKYRNSTRAIRRKEFNRDFTKIAKAHRTDPQQLREGLMTTPFILLKDSRASNLIYLKPDQLRFGVEDVLWSKKSIGTYSAVLVTKKVHQFLQKLNIPQWDIVDEVVETILPKYERNPPRVPTEEHMSDFEKITLAYNTCKQSRKMQLETELQATHFILAENPNSDFPIYLKPDRLYFRTDALQMYFERNSLVYWIKIYQDNGDDLAELWNMFTRNSFFSEGPTTGAFVDFDKYPRAAYALFEKLGIVDDVRVKKKKKDWHGHVTIESRYGHHKRGRNGFDPDMQVDGLACALKYPTPEKSAFIWNHIARHNVDYIRGVVEESTRQDYTNISPEDVQNVLSDWFGNLLVTSAWLPDIDGNMHKPSEITLPELPESFQRDEQLASQLRMKTEAEAEFAEGIGLPREMIDDIKQNPGEYAEFFKARRAAQKTHEHGEVEIPEQSIQDEDTLYDETPVDTSSIPSESLTDVGEKNSSSAAKGSETPEGSEHTDLVGNKSTPHASSRASVSDPSSRDSSQEETSHTETGSGSGRHGEYGDGVGILLPEEISENEIFYEGVRKQISVNTYERDRTARDKCLQHYDTRCAVCEKDMSEIYGPEAAGLIHVHHLKPLSEIKEGYRVNPIADLRPVCPNCHAVIHRRRKPPYKIEEVKGFLEKVKQDE